MQPNLSPYGPVDLGRVGAFLRRPNMDLQNVEKPNDEVFGDAGYVVMKSAVSPQLCAKAIAQYDAFEALREERKVEVRDVKGRNYRVNNLHLASDALLDIGTTKVFHDFASSYLRRQSLVYTSLSYKHGSQQDPHLDTPFFWTRPFNLYVGVWVALEQVRAEAGPLFYYEGSHKYFNSEDDLRAVWKESGQNVGRMFGIIRQHIEGRCRRHEATVNAGDAVIWHPGLVHGGTRATDPTLTRYSCVYHFGAVGVNIRDERAFPEDFVNVPMHGLLRRNGQYYARKNLPKVMLHEPV